MYSSVLPEMSASSMLPYPYRIREESRKTWEHGESNEIVHFGEPFDAEGDTFISFVDHELRSTVWIELHFVLVGQSDSHYCAIIDLLMPDLPDSVRLKLPFRKDAVGSNVSMLLDVPQLIQLPQTRRTIIIPSVIRLKRFNDGDCIGGHSFGSSLDTFPCFGIVSLADGEANPRTRDCASQVCQLPSEMIQTGPQVRNEVSRYQGGQQYSFVMAGLNPNDI